MEDTLDRLGGAVGSVTAREVEIPEPTRVVTDDTGRAPAVLPRRAGRHGESRLGPRVPDEIVRVGAAPTQPLPRTADRSRGARILPLPEVTSLGVPGLAWAIGRVSIGVAAAGAAHRVHVTAVRGRTVTSSLLEVGAMSAAALLGILATVWWSTTAASNVRRLGVAAPRPFAVAAAWLLPIAWIPAGTALMHIDVRAEVDPMPALAVAGLAIALAVPYLVVADTTRTIGRTRPLGRWWAVMWGADTSVIAVAWLAVVTHSSGSSWSAWPGTAAAIGAWSSIVPLLAALVIAARVPRLLRLRLARLEHDRTVAADPTWFRTGFARGAERRAPVDLLPSAPWGRATAVSFGAWAAATVAAAVVASSPMWFGASAPGVYSTGAAAGSLAAGCAAVVALACWATTTAINARRLTSVGAVPPTVPAALGLPAPLALIGALAVGGEAGWLIGTSGVVVAGAAAMVTLRAMASISVSHRASSAGFRAWAAVTGLAVVAASGAMLTVGTATLPWSSIELAHAFVPLQVAALATIAVVAYRSTASLDRRLAESARRLVVG